MIPLAAYLLLFLAVGIGFIFVHLVAGKLIRPNKPDAEKGTIYECGEPTIGSAWVQFDLRFYVVALLFVIFDVEVAFFFPWAEVFGKGNAIANATNSSPNPKEYPNSPKEHRDWGALVLDLSAPANASKLSDEKRKRWETLRDVSDEESKAFLSLTPEQVRTFRYLKEPQVKGLKALAAEQRDEARKQAAALSQFVSTLRQEQEQALRKVVDLDDRIKKLEEQIKQAGEKGGADSKRVDALTKELTDFRDLKGFLDSELSQSERNARNASLQNLADGRITLLGSLRQPPAPGQPSPLRTRLVKIDEKNTTAVVALADKQAERLQSESKSVLAALNKAGPDQAALWPDLSIVGLEQVGELTEKQLEGLPHLTPAGLHAMSDPQVASTQTQARQLAWMALIEILVFFGVLLVGFAYLWRRGDLEWVRSTAAERLEARGQTPPELPPAPAPVPARETVAS
jgi:NADH:ubiquinone oxidoreductase subunit 3 (subunit A)